MANHVWSVEEIVGLLSDGPVLMSKTGKSLLFWAVLVITAVIVFRLVGG